MMHAARNCLCNCRACIAAWGGARAHTPHCFLLPTREPPGPPCRGGTGVACPCFACIIHIEVCKACVEHMAGTYPIHELLVCPLPIAVRAQLLHQPLPQPAAGRVGLCPELPARGEGPGCGVLAHRCAPAPGWRAGNVVPPLCIPAPPLTLPPLLSIHACTRSRACHTCLLLPLSRPQALPALHQGLHAPAPPDPPQPISPAAHPIQHGGRRRQPHAARTACAAPGPHPHWGAGCRVGWHQPCAAAQRQLAGAWCGGGQQGAAGQDGSSGQPHAVSAWGCNGAAAATAATAATTPTAATRGIPLTCGPSRPCPSHTCGHRATTTRATASTTSSRGCCCSCTASTRVATTFTPSARTT